MHALLLTAIELVVFWMRGSKTDFEEKGRGKNMKIIWFRFRKQARNQKQIHKHELDIYRHYYCILQCSTFLKTFQTQILKR